MSARQSSPGQSLAGDMTDLDLRSDNGGADAAAERNRQREEEDDMPAAPVRNRNRVRIGRDQADVPNVRDETGEKVTELFQQFLEQ